MAETTIEWTATRLPDGTTLPGYTFNPWIGCARVSKGCQFCYAETLMDTRYGRVEWGVHGTRVRTSVAYWRKPLTWNRQAERDGVRRKVFCASLADVFEDREELGPWRGDLLDLIYRTPHLDWLLLTKRPENVVPLIHAAVVDLLENPAVTAVAQESTAATCLEWLDGSPPANVWIGTSVEHQQAADERIPHLLRIPATVRFLSCEPLLGPVYLTVVCEKKWEDGGIFIDALTGDRWKKDGFDCPLDKTGQIHWVIVGGESGQGARPMHPNWARSLRGQCQAAGVAFHFKQWGAWIPREQIADWRGSNPDDPRHSGWVIRDEWRDTARAAKEWGTLTASGKYFPETSTWNGGELDPRNDHEVTVYRVGKKAAGRLLDGREWNEYPGGGA